MFPFLADQLTRKKNICEINSIVDILPQVLTIPSFISSRLCFIKISYLNQFFEMSRKDMELKVTFLKHLFDGSI